MSDGAGFAFRGIGRMFGNGVGARLAGLLVLFSLGVTLAVTALQMYVEYRNEQASLGGEMLEFQKETVPAIAAAVAGGDHDIAQALIDGMAGARDIERVEIRGPGGLFAASGEIQSHDVEQRVFPLESTLEGSTRLLGEVRIVAGLDDLYGRLRWRTLGVLAADALIIFLVTGFLLLLVHNFITRHLASIAATLRSSRLAEGHVPIVLARERREGDELDEVVDAVNRAGERLHEAYRKLASELALRREAEEGLRRAHHEMELRVEQRTAELAAANGELSAEIRRRQHAETALRESEARARVMLDWSILEAVLANRDGVIRGANKAFAERTGVAVDRLDGRILREVLASETADAYGQRIRQVLSAGRDLDFEHEEGERAYAVHVSPIPGDIAGEKLVAVFSRDITPERQAAQLREDVERITRHDLKAPIIGILSAIQALRLREDLSGDLTKTLQDMEDAGYLGLDLINRSLDLFRMEKGIYELRPEPVALETVVADVARSMREVAMRRHVQIVSPCTDCDHPCIRVLGERTLCFSMMSNLVKNAVEASQPGGNVTITCGERQGRAIIDIHNQGVVPEQIRGRVFEKYVSSGKHGGTGLGTYSARLIARTHGGDVRLATSKEEGTTFTISLPLAPAEATEMAANGE